ncbi:MAG: NAD(P)H-quinone oxidoreductase [Calditrichaeota bacterium]|nr:NAD(P)H-quinone oxidoreductase [Calditrichota bacterium]RQW02630.1 MAG: NAD(P)H-quinone oxidoreductase [Calditrichota bacterium]
MKAVLISKPGSAENLVLGDIIRPVPGPNELLVKVKATALNRADILQREGKYPPPPGTSELLGLEMSGIIEETGQNCKGWSTGQSVFGLLSGGGYAQYATIDYRMALPKPEILSHEEAAAIPESFLTAFQALVWLARIQPDESVLIHAGASGVGTSAIQLAREMGAHIFVTAGSDEKIKKCLELGAEFGTNYKNRSFFEPLMEATGEKGIDVIIDFVGEPFWDQNIEALATDGRIVILATMGGSEIPRFSLRQLIRKRATITGSTLRNRPLYYKIDLTRSFTEFAYPLLKSGRIRPVIGRIFSWEDVVQAHRYMEQNLNIGKIVLRVTD